MEARAAGAGSKPSGLSSGRAGKSSAQEHGCAHQQPPNSDLASDQESNHLERKTKANFGCSALGLEFILSEH